MVAHDRSREKINSDARLSRYFAYWALLENWIDLNEHKNLAHLNVKCFTVFLTA